MTDDLLKRFESVRVFAKGGKLAPHKLLLLLYALSKLKNEKAERISFTDAEDVVRAPFLPAFLRLDVY